MGLDRAGTEGGTGSGAMKGLGWKEDQEPHIKKRKRKKKNSPTK